MKARSQKLKIEDSDDTKEERKHGSKEEENCP